jgi:tetratricopeptide (TPR) repeat protein
VSATSADLRSCRELIRDALLTLQCVPVEQANFPPDYRSVREMLRRSISNCDAMVHVVGECYGVEPKKTDPLAPRRSCTQMEYDMAREMNKRVYVFICGEGFPYDQHVPEDPERQYLQKGHRVALLTADEMRYTVRSHDDLKVRVRELQTQVELLRFELIKAETRVRQLRVSFFIVGVAAVILGIWLARRTMIDEKDIKDLRAAVKKQTYPDEVINAFNTPLIIGDGETLTNDQKYRNALHEVAVRKKIPDADLQKMIEQFAASNRGNKEHPFVQGQASYLQMDFKPSADESARAAEQAHAERLVLYEKMVRDREQFDVVSAKERDAYNLHGQATYALKDYGEAAKAFEAALAVTDKDQMPEKWAALQVRRGLALNEWASASQGAVISTRRFEAIKILRQALAVQTAHSLAEESALTLNYLAIDLREQATRADAAHRSELLGESIDDAKRALEHYDSSRQPKEWALTANNLANALAMNAHSIVGRERASRLAGAVKYYRSAIEFLSPDNLRKERAIVQNNLALALRDQAASSNGSAGTLLLSDAIKSCDAALNVLKDGDSSVDWASVQMTLGLLRSSQAAKADGANRRNLLAIAVHCYRQSLEKLNLDLNPQEWALAKSNLGSALGAQAAGFAGTERSLILEDEMANYQAALTAFTQEALPQDWARTECNLAIALRDQATSSGRGERGRLLDASVQDLRSVLEVRRSDILPEDWARTITDLADTLSDQASLSSQSERVPLLAEAERSYRMAIKFYDEADMKRNLAAAQINLSRTLLLIAISGSGDPTEILRDAALQCQSALVSFTFDASPQDWAKAQNAIGLIMQAQARTAPDPGPLLREAIDSHEKALNVFTYGAMPQDWANTNCYLAAALHEKASDSRDPAESKQRLKSATAADLGALQVYDKDTDGEEWYLADSNLARDLRALIAVSSESERSSLIAQLVAAERALLAYNDVQMDRKRWADVENNLASALAMDGDTFSQTERSNLEESADAYRAVLKVQMDKGEREGQAETQYSLASVLLRLASVSSGADRATILSQSISASREALELSDDVDDRIKANQLLSKAEDALRNIHDH